MLFAPGFGIYTKHASPLTEALAATVIAQQQTINALRARPRR